MHILSFKETPTQKSRYAILFISCCTRALLVLLARRSEFKLPTGHCTKLPESVSDTKSTIIDADVSLHMFKVLINQLRERTTSSSL